MIRSISSDIDVIASTTRGAAVKPSCAENRAARIIRSGSSANDSCGSAGVSSTFSRSASMPSCGSMNVFPTRSIAIALTVKSRRSRSPSMVSPKVTSGLRPTRS